MSARLPKTSEQRRELSTATRPAHPQGSRLVQRGSRMACRYAHAVEFSAADLSVLICGVALLAGAVALFFVRWLRSDFSETRLLLGGMLSAVLGTMLIAFAIASSFFSDAACTPC